MKKDIFLGKKPEDGKTVGQPFPKGMGGCDNFRIPGIVTLKDGTLVASADARWNLEKDGGGSDLVISRSTDGGVTWNYSFVGYLGDNGNSWNPNSSTLMDPLIMTDGKTLYLLADLFPAKYSISLESTTNVFTEKQTGFNSQGKLLLSADRRKTFSYYMENGNIFEENGQKVEGYRVDGWFHLYFDEIYISNLFFENSPFQVCATSYIILITSEDGGKSWSAPSLLNVKTPETVWMVLGPGKGLVTKEGTLLFSSYDGKTVYLFFSNDKGKTWKYVQTEQADGESQLVELEDGTIRMFVRSMGVNKIQYMDFIWQDHTYCPGNLVNTGIDNFSNCMISVLKCTSKRNKEEVIFVSCPSDSTGGIWGGRFYGTVYAFVLDKQNKMILKAKHRINDAFFAYSCMTELPEYIQRNFEAEYPIAILYENDCISYQAGGYRGACSQINYTMIKVPLSF